MANIQRGDIRTYLSRGIAEQDFSGDAANILNSGVQSAYTITQKANESTMANNQIDLSAKFLMKNNEINTKYQADPTNPQREIELQEAFESLASQYKINPVCEKQWADIKNNVYGRYKMYNAQWVEKQQETNIQNNLKNGYENLTNQISMLGLNGASVDEMRLIYANGIEGLRNGAIAGLGEVVVDNFLKDSNHDIMTTYISALAQNNPVEAQRLLQDEGVRNDIGRAETLEKLDKYVMSSLANQSKKVAVNELCNTLRNMNSEESQKILNGQADLNAVMKFIESNKNMPEASKDLILDIYGLGSTTEYIYDRDKKRILKKEDAGSGSSSGGKGSSSLKSLSKLSKTEKEDIVADLEGNIIDMFSFNSDAVNPKKVLKEKNGAAHQDNIISRLQSVANAQGAIDTALNAGLINQTTRKRLMDNYISPMTDYLENKMGQLDEKSGWFGPKLGYGRLKQEFGIDNIPASHTNKIREQKLDLLAAQGYYYKNLDNARKGLNLNSIYDIEKLDKTDQEKIYKKASDMAIDSVKRNSLHPENFFKREYPQLYAAGVEYFGVNDGNKIAREVSKRIYGAEDKSKIDPVKEMSDELMKTKAIKTQEAKNITKAIQAVNEEYPAGRMLLDEEIEERAKALGLSVKQLTNDAYSKRVSPQMYLIYLENLKRYREGIKK